MKSQSRAEELRRDREIVVIGDSGAGKTALFRRLRNAEDPFQEYSTRSMITADIGLPALEGSVSIHDIPGDYAASRLKSSLNGKEAIAVVVAVDLAHHQDGSLGDSTRGWLEAFSAASEHTSVSVARRILVSTREDMGTSKHNVDRLEKLAKELGFDFVFRTSAKTGEGVNELRSALAEVVAQIAKHPDAEIASPVAQVVRAMAACLCELVARNPRILEQIEWRDLERVIATALSGIGFSVELTRPAKDGGKDVIVRCVAGGIYKVFYIEIKHWLRNRSGMDDVTSFVEVNARDATDGGLFLSSSGYTQEVFAQLGEISRQRVRLGDSPKISSLCRYYVKQKGIWHSERPLPDLLFEETLG
ncbi:GTPase SAR1 family protein [Bradyrhizobium sp. JR4.1]|uniref:restriction endonuclease n=1 Tax=unclassified Bradyrhizobium TaxID=2631580 RepID=UPI00339A6B01